MRKEEEIYLRCGGERGKKGCGEYKPLSDFQMNRRNAYRCFRQLYCRDCINPPMKKYQQEHPKENLARATKWREENPDRFRELWKRYSKHNWSSQTAYDANFKAKSLGVPGRLTGPEIKALAEKQGYICANPDCKNDPSTTQLSLDHIIAFSDPACKNVISNCQMLCKPCNTRKAHLDGDVNAKQWLVTWPNKMKRKITNLAKFCRQNNLYANNMYQVASGEQQTHKGFKCQRLGRGK